MRSASSASITRPVISRSLLWAAPTSRGSSHDAPISVLLNPLTMPVALKRLPAAAKRSSAARLRHIPPPYASPLTAAMIGWGSERISGVSRE